MRNNEAKPNGARGVAYLRVSSDKQDDKSQEEIIRKWLDRNELQVGHWYRDIGSRDMAYARLDFQRMLEAARKGLIDWIIVSESDRYGARDAYQKMGFLDELRNNNVELWSIHEGLLTDSKIETQMLNVISAASSEKEIIEKANRTIRGKETRVHSGEWQGGTPPLGYDLIAVSPEGKELWRIHYESRILRVKILPDGRRERYDGPRNFPRRDKGVTLRLVPSIDAKQVELVRWIFQTFASEAITIRGLCTRLIEMKADPGPAEGWYSSRLGPMMRNPAYVSGSLVYNKRGGGKKREMIGGVIQDVPRVKGRVKFGRKRATTDYIHAKATPGGLIDQKTWDLVQAKLAGVKSSAKAPRNPNLWLAGLLFCGNCRKRMCGWSSKNIKPSYTCTTYQKYGLKNATGCKHNRVRHDEIEPILVKYLEESNQKLDALLKLENDDSDAIKHLEQSSDEKDWEFCRAMTKLWRAVKNAGLVPRDGQHWHQKNLIDQFRQHRQKTEKERADAIAGLEAKLEQMVEAFVELSPATRNIARKKMAAVEEEMAALRVEPLDEQLVYLRGEFKAMRQAVVDARGAWAVDGNRVKAAAMARVIKRVVCRFDYKQHGRLERSVLREVTVEPESGSAIAYFRDDASRGQD